MSDLFWAAAWLALLGVGVGGCVVLHRLGLSSTYARDLMHVGTGVWVLGWPLWSGAAAPMLIAFAALLATSAVPVLAARSATAQRVHGSFASGDERWNGLVLYTAAYAAFTGVGLAASPFAAGAALLALSLGDGVGGAVGRRFGRRHFRAPGGKRKSIEGSLVVALGATLGATLAAWRFDAEVGPLALAIIGLSAAVSEAMSPRGTDNLVVPVTVWAVAEVASRAGGGS